MHKPRYDVWCHFRYVHFYIEPTGLAVEGRTYLSDTFGLDGTDTPSKQNYGHPSTASWFWANDCFLSSYPETIGL